jgi:hypothetical protein
MRTLKVAVYAALTCGSISLIASSAPAAVLTVGTSNQPYGGYVCADVRSANIAPYTPIQAYDCNAAPNQQYEFNGLTIYALGAQRCVDVQGGGTANGTLVDSYPCNGTVAQQWYYYNGEIYNPHSEKCLDAGNMANLTQLVIKECDGSESQTWQIK